MDTTPEPELIRKPDEDGDEEREPLFYVREFLNLPRYNSVAYIFAEVEDVYRSYHGYPELVLGDCGRQIKIDLTLHGADNRKNTFYKLDLLINTLISLREAIKIAAAKVEAMEKKPEKVEGGEWVEVPFVGPLPT